MLDKDASWEPSPGDLQSTGSRVEAWGEGGAGITEGIFVPSGLEVEIPQQERKKERRDENFLGTPDG